MRSSPTWKRRRARWRVSTRSCGNKVEHYEIASYGTLAALAKQLGCTKAIPLLLETLEEEKAADQKLTLLAEQVANQKAAENA
jgi:ferritin-like metal-binding protein YciE